ncbi:transcription factor E2F7 isoform X2 [Bombina bombina]|uniref:transcription factor E2F7 isoform X2 n=1 Tax=Bombina bombina TaxID=8345 RepID=UPI00235B1199|nr:transcription factor E2F7 isoform X2 [Bombina bombina]
MEMAGCLTLKDLISTRKSKVDPVIDLRSSQKENMFDRFKVSPRVSLKSEPIDLSKQKGFTPERIPITPVKSVDRPQEPWTPTANLKMLISVASPEIRDWEKKKELFRPIENKEQEVVPCSQQFEVVDDIDELEKRPSRKQKSLGLLCQKFLARYPSHPLSTEKTAISLDEAAASLGVERRRIYDIVNVLESLQLVSRVAKNQYCWHGQHNLQQTLKNLQRIGEQQKYDAQIAYQQRDMSFETKNGEWRKESTGDGQNMYLLELSEVDGPSASASSRKDKSLRIMSQKFVMLFLASSTKIITLEIAAKILIEESQDVADHSKFKTKVRRLYDIANVLTSLGLIKKVHVTEERGRKPAFKWIGPTDFMDNHDQRIDVTPTSSPNYKREANILFAASGNTKERLSRHSSFNKPPSSNNVKRKVCSEPSSPHKAPNVCMEACDSYSSKMAHLAAVCRQKIEEDSTNQNLSHKNTVLQNASHLPFSVVVPIDSEYCLTPVVHQGSSTAQNVTNGQSAAMPNSHPGAELSNHTLVPNQPYMYLPSSVFMLCGKLGEESVPSAEEHPTEESSVVASATTDLKHTAISEDEMPTKRPRIAMGGFPHSFVPERFVSSNSCESLCREDEKVIPNGNLHRGVSDNEVLGDTFQISKIGLQENQKSTVLPPYFYVTPAAGLNGFNFFLPSSQTASTVSPSQLASLKIPCMVVPSSSSPGYPLFCSPAVPNSTVPSPVGMNLNLPAMTSATPLIIGAQPMVSRKVSEYSPDLPHNLSTEPILKTQKSPTPLTPKNVRPAHRDAFFKTPGDAGVPSFVRKSEGAHFSSVQRRLEISSSAGE